MYFRYVEVLALNASDIYRQMSGAEGFGYRIEPDRRTNTVYSLALFIPYTHLSGRLNGNFLLGFENPESAVRVASAIAGGLCLEAIRELDRNAIDVLTEFMNVVMGRTLAGWEKIGFDVAFDPPRVEQYAAVCRKPEAGASAYVIHLDLADHSVAFGVTFNDFSPAERPAEKQ